MRKKVGHRQLREAHNQEFLDGTAEVETVTVVDSHGNAPAMRRPCNPNKGSAIVRQF